MLPERREPAGRGFQNPAAVSACTKEFPARLRRSNPTGVRTTKYITDITIGVVTREMACASAIQARSTGPRYVGTINPARMSRPPTVPKPFISHGCPRHQVIAASTAKAPPTVRPKRRPCATVNRVGTRAAIRVSPTISVGSAYRAGTAREPGNRCVCA